MKQYMPMETSSHSEKTHSRKRRPINIALCVFFKTIVVLSALVMVIMPESWDQGRITLLQLLLTEAALGCVTFVSYKCWTSIDPVFMGHSDKE